jgi:threonine/homoserine/homoserine lactone efflux protein
MLDLARFPLFLAASLALLLSPGPAVLYITARSIDQGRRAGLVSVLSIEAGNFMHVIFAAVGISALLASSEQAFTAVKLLGASYLVYLGVRRLLSPPHIYVSESNPQPSGIFWQGVAVAVLNPKTALFFLAFLPQFVSPKLGPPAPQIFLLGLAFVLMACFTDSMYALLAGSARDWLRRSGWFPAFERFFAASVFVGLGLYALLSDLL